MAEASVPVDLFNPGQVFACLGFLEAAEILLGEAEGGFDWSGDRPPRFRLRSPGAADPVREVLAFLAEARVSTYAPAGSGLTTAAWRVGTDNFSRADHPFPFPEPDSPATLPARLTRDSDSKFIDIEYWGDDFAETHRDNVKFWAGAAGYPGAALAEDALALVRKQKPETYAEDPFNLGARQSSSFRFDWRRDYVPMEIGFSLNAHSGDRFCPVGYPLVEILAAIGMTSARPERVSPANKLDYRYSVPQITAPDVFYPLPLLRASLGGTPLPFPRRTFRVTLDWPGQENQARCITKVIEEPASA
jgi:CRISPR-associated protein Csb3